MKKIPNNSSKAKSRKEVLSVKTLDMSKRNLVVIKPDYVAMRKAELSKRTK